MARTNKAVYTPLGASNHSLGDREVNDYYATEPKAADLLAMDAIHSYQRNTISMMQLTRRKPPGGSL